MEKSRCIETIRSAVNSSIHPGAPDEDIFRPTSVMALFVFDGQTRLVFIQKADVPGYPWAGQMAFPGGHKDKRDLTTRHTALRELEEEMGIRKENVEVIGSLGHFQTINDRDIEAWVGVWNGKDLISSDPCEIGKVFKIPLKTLMNHHIKKGFHQFEDPPNVMALTYPYKDVEIWGVTAKIVYHLIEVLRRKNPMS